MRIAHVINTFKCSPDNSSNLHQAQNITFKSMRTAQIAAAKLNIAVDLCAVGFKDDYEHVPDYFIKLPKLERSTRDTYKSNKQLPFVQDIINAVMSASSADVIILTNVDIGLLPEFYITVATILNSTRLKAFTTNRRDIELTKVYSEKDMWSFSDASMASIYKAAKSKTKSCKHPGYDCFVIRRDVLKNVNLKNMFVGYPPWGLTLKNILDKVAFGYSGCFKQKLKITFHLGFDNSWSWGHRLARKNLASSRKCLQAYGCEPLNFPHTKPLDKSKKNKYLAVGI
jgi:hypothetical protein